MSVCRAMEADMEGKRMGDLRLVKDFKVEEGFFGRYEKLVKDQTGENPPRVIVGPKTLNVYGAPYVWAVFTGIGLIEEETYIQEVLEL